jgi:hypothetical protein
MEWGVFVQGQVSPDLIVTRNVRFEDAAQVRLAEHDDMVETLPSERAYHAFGVSILPR